MFTYKKQSCFTVVHIFSFLHSMTFDLISGLHMQIQTWHPPLWLFTHAKYYDKSGLTNVLKNANKTKNMHLFSIQIANYTSHAQLSLDMYRRGVILSPGTGTARKKIA